MGRVLTSGNAVIVPHPTDRPDDVRIAGSLALWNRAKGCPDGRAIVVCYDPPTCEALDIARDKLGIEFLTPEELVESLKADQQAR
jgi:hypothetical protein